MPQQRCPEVERLQQLIGRMKQEPNEKGALKTLHARDGAECEEHEEITEALIWLKNFLLARRNYQRKTQVKRKIMTKLLAEQGFAEEIDERVKATYGEELERFDDNTTDED